MLAGVNHLTWKECLSEFEQKIKSMRDEAPKYSRPFHKYVSYCSTPLKLLEIASLRLISSISALGHL